MSDRTYRVRWLDWKAHLIGCEPCSGGRVCGEGREILGPYSRDEAPWLLCTCGVSTGHQAPPHRPECPAAVAARVAQAWEGTR